MTDVYQLGLFAAKCLIEVKANGLLLFRRDAKEGIALNYPLNTELIGEGNALVIDMFPTILADGTPSRYSDVTIQGTLKKYEADDIAGPESGELLTSFTFEDVKAVRDVEAITGTDLSKLFPMSKTLTFDSIGPSFRNRLIEAPPIADEGKLLDYAELLRDILARQDIEALYTEYRPKLEDYAIAYPSEFPDPRAWFNEFFLNDFFPGGPVVDFRRDDIGLRSWCDGRIWEIFVKPAQRFFLNQGLDGDINSIEVYVGMVDNHLRIVR